MKKESYTRPNEIEYKIHLGQRQYSINYDIVENDEIFEYNSVELPLGVFSYDAIVNAIISDEYPSDKMQAVINNYLLDSEKGKEEFEQMQNCRTKAKAIAKQLLESEL